MSASPDDISFTSDTGGFLSSIASFVSRGGNVAQLFTAGLVGVIFRPLVSVVDVIRTGTNAITDPIEAATSAVVSLTTALFTAPADLVISGAEISEAALASVLGESLAGILALPISVATTLGVVFLIIQFLQEDETGNFGLISDVPLPFIGVEEEGEE